jgi:GNAT superfamily N-acetyltransferase
MTSVRVSQEKLKTGSLDVAELVLETQLDLARRNITAAYFPIREELDETLVLRAMNGELAAVLVWRKYVDSIWIIIAAVKDGFRGQGLHQLLHQELDKVARQLGIGVIETYVGTENKSVLRSYEKMGITPQMYYIKKKVP